jgi:lysozyme
MAREINQEGLDLIKRSEGLRLQVYKDAVGKATIGYGHLILAGEDFSGGITEEEAEEILKKDLERTEIGVEQAVDVDLTDNQFAALVSFAFNLGVRTLQRSTLLMLVNKGDFDSAADEFPKWCYAGGKQLKGLVTRRLAERDLFLE